MRIFLTVLFVAAVNADPIGKSLHNEVNGLDYVLVYRAQPWDIARAMCNEAGMKLAVPSTEQEFTFLQNIVRGMQYRQITNNNQYKLLVWVGVNNLDDYTVWRTVDGETLNQSAFSKYLDDEESSDSPQEPHCVGLDAHNPSLRTFWCHRHQPYICQSDPTRATFTTTDTQIVDFSGNETW